MVRVSQGSVPRPSLDGGLARFIPMLALLSRSSPAPNSVHTAFLQIQMLGILGDVDLHYPEMTRYAITVAQLSNLNLVRIG